ncbi:MAG: polysaccharide deacetylase family protein [Phycisphaerae bacterium]|nr:polysaccharide deacetylase family protein [Phycisphaerae bacterium]
MLHGLVIILASILALSVVGLVGLCLWETRSPRLVCLMYHRLSPREAYRSVRGTERVFALPVDAFDAQLEYLKSAGYECVSAGQVRAFAAGELPMPRRAVLITFDDGCRSVASLAVPSLARFGAKATVFVTTDPSAYVFDIGAGYEPRLTEEEMKALDGGVVEFESHSVTHRPLRGLAEDEIRNELAGSKRQLEQLLSRPVEYLAIPGNWWNAKVMQVAREVGYRAVWVSNPGFVRPGSNRYGLHRVNVEGEFTLGQFITAMSPWGIAQRRPLSFIKRLPGRILGPAWWLPLRKVILRFIPGGHLSMRRMVLITGVLAASMVAILLLWFLG